MAGYFHVLGTSCLGVKGMGCRILGSGLGLRVQCSGFGVQGSGFRV